MWEEGVPQTLMSSLRRQGSMEPLALAERWTPAFAGVTAGGLAWGLPALLPHTQSGTLSSAISSSIDLRGRMTCHLSPSTSTSGISGREL